MTECNHRPKCHMPDPMSNDPCPPCHTEALARNARIQALVQGDGPLAADNFDPYAIAERIVALEDELAAANIIVEAAHKQCNGNVNHPLFVEVCAWRQETGRSPKVVKRPIKGEEPRALKCGLTRYENDESDDGFPISLSGDIELVESHSEFDELIRSLVPDYLTGRIRTDSESEFIFLYAADPVAADWVERTCNAIHAKLNDYDMPQPLAQRVESLNL